MVRIETARRVAGLFEFHDLLPHLGAGEWFIRLLSEGQTRRDERTDKKPGNQQFHGYFPLLHSNDMAQRRQLSFSIRGRLARCKSETSDCVLQKTQQWFRRVLMG